MKQKLLKLALFAIIMLPFTNVEAQHAHEGMKTLDFTQMNTWFGLVELPFLFICMYYAFKTATSLKGGIFGKGMSLMAWGFLVMGIGHLHMQIEHFMGINIFNHLLGETLGSITWFLALVTTWVLSGWGFYSIYNVSKKQ